MIVAALIIGLLCSVLGAPQDNIGGRIFNGRDADIEDYPYALQLTYMDKLVCGAALIADRYALTAGHCVAAKDIEYLELRGGTTNLFEGGQVFTIESIVYHPKFNLLVNNYDAAVLYLYESVTIPLIKPIALETNNSIPLGVNVTIVGWGWLEPSYDDDTYASILQATEVVTITVDQCNELFIYHPPVTEAMFCAVYQGDVTDFCYGDHGGPVIYEGIMLGIISFGQGCGTKQAPGVFIRVPLIHEWIESIINEEDREI